MGSIPRRAEIKLLPGALRFVTIASLGALLFTAGCQDRSFEQRTLHQGKPSVEPTAGTELGDDNADNVAQRETARVERMNAEDYLNRGVVNANRGDFDKAIVDFTQAVRLRPDFALPYNERGRVYYETGDLDKAIADYDKAIIIAPDLAVARHNRGLVYQDRGDARKAIAEYSEAIRLELKNAETFYNRGCAYNSVGDLDNAIADFTEAIRLKPEHVDAYLNRGSAFAVKGELDNAIADYTNVIRLKPEDAEAYYNRGVAHCDNGDFDEAVADYNQTLRLQSSYLEAYNELAWLQATCLDEKLRDGDKAVVNAARAHLLGDGKTWEFTDTLAAAFAEVGDFDRAVQWQRKAIGLAPETARERLQIRLERYKQGKPYRGQR